MCLTFSEPCGCCFKQYINRHIPHQGTRKTHLYIHLQESKCTGTSNSVYMYNITCVCEHTHNKHGVGRVSNRTHTYTQLTYIICVYVHTQTQTETEKHTLSQLQTLLRETNSTSVRVVETENRCSASARCHRGERIVRDLWVSLPRHLLSSGTEANRSSIVILASTPHHDPLTHSLFMHESSLWVYAPISP